MFFKYNKEFNYNIIFNIYTFYLSQFFFFNFKITEKNFQILINIVERY